MPTQHVAKTIAEKKEVLDWIEEHGDGVPTRAVKHFQNEKGWMISGVQIRYWWKNQVAIRNAQLLQLRLKGGGAKPTLGEIEDLLFDQILQLRFNKEKVSRQWIQASARELVKDELENSEFTASDKAVSFMGYLDEQKPAFDLARTVLMDGSAVYFEDPRRDTVDVTGAHHVVLRSTGFVSMRVTAVLAVSASRKKLPPLAIWKGMKQMSAIEKYDQVFVAYQEKSWIDSSLLLQWLELVFPARMDFTSGKDLVWDSIRAHISKAVKAKCAAKKIDMVVVSGGLTPYLQAGDIGIFKSFKDQLSSIINEWKGSSRVEYTRFGNPKPPAIGEVAAWVAQAWKGIPDSVVLQSVNAAGFDSDYRNWRIIKHVVYGTRFLAKWIDRDREAEVALDKSCDVFAFDKLTIDE